MGISMFLWVCLQIILFACVCVEVYTLHVYASATVTQKLAGHVNSNKHFQASSVGFIIHHYAGQVTYDVEGFCERNRDVLFNDLIQLMQSSTV